MAAPVAAAAPPVADAPVAKSGGKRRLIVIGGVVLALAGGGVYWWKTRQAAAAAPAATPDVPASKRGLVTFDPFVANLADEGGRRFVRATVQLVVANAEVAKEVEESKVMLMQARAVILDELTQQVADGLVTPEGKAALRKAIAERVAESLHEIEVVDVLFSDFVVQF
jgi:flagellar FliL protein